MIPYDVCVMHRSIKMHYTSDTYDYFTYNGKIRLKGSTFDSDPSRYHYLTLMNKFQKNKGELEQFFAANLYYKPNEYIANLLDQESSNIYFDHKKYLESLEYHFSQDLEHLHSKYTGKINLLFKGSEPLIIQCAQAKEISRYSFIILDDLLGFTDVIRPSDTIIWPQHKKMLKKFARFIRPYYTKKDMGNIMLGIYNDK